MCLGNLDDVSFYIPSLTCPPHESLRQAQDRAHRIGQKRPVQVFRLVTEDTIEQKVVERAQQKLKLDAMVVQQGRLKEKDKLSREELLDAVRFGADKIFKSKDSSITDDDVRFYLLVCHLMSPLFFSSQNENPCLSQIDMILGYGKKKTKELYDKLQAAQKGDMLDFKLDGGLSAQTFEGVDYSEEAKNAQFQAEIMGIIDVGKRERRTVAYNENKLYMQQMAQHGGAPPKKKIKKEIQLPKMLRLPRIEEWQMFDRTSLYALQDIEEEAFRALPQEVQALAGGIKRSSPADETKETTDIQPHTEGATTDDAPMIDIEGKTADAPEATKEEPHAEEETEIKSLPPLLSEEQQAEKRRLLAEGFSDWSRHHYSAFVKASAKYGRHNHAKIAIDVGKPLSSVKTYSAAFWDENFGKQRFSEHEYERVVKLIEKGERKIEDIKGLQRGTKVLISLFENAWVELQFTHVNCKDKKFTTEEDRFLLCWAHKVNR
jgi:SWI/SNF-related matrix-associated actin-dependent regulator of chromatin subfamily A member 5